MKNNHEHFGCYGYGGELELAAQAALTRQHKWIATKEHLLSQGRTLLVFFTHPKVQQIAPLIKKFRRVLIYGGYSILGELSGQLRDCGFTVDCNLNLVSGSTTTVWKHLDAVDQSQEFPSDLQFEVLDVNSSPSQVRAIQELHCASHLSPLPGWFMRGDGIRSRTIFLVNTNGKIIGSSTFQDLSPAGASVRGIGMVLSVCLHEEFRGRRLSLFLNAAALRHGITTFGVHELWEIVDSTNQPSLSMNKKCGLRIHDEATFIFATVFCSAQMGN